MINNKTYRVAIVLASFIFISACSNSRHYISLDNRKLSDYAMVEISDPDKLGTIILDSMQYRNYLLSYSDTSNVYKIHGVAHVDKKYKFNHGLVLLVTLDSTQYEVIIVVSKKSKMICNIAEGEYYYMKIQPYFYYREPTLIGHRKRYIYLDHYVIMPAYILDDKTRICTASISDITKYSR